MIQMYSVGFSFPLNGSEAVHVLNVDAFRPRRFATNVLSDGVAFINGIHCGKSGNQLLQEVDAWQFSRTLSDHLRDSFLKEHGLMGKTFEQVDDYLDENGLSIPDVGALVLPPMSRGETIRITGRFTVPMLASLVGEALT